MTEFLALRSAMSAGVRAIKRLALLLAVIAAGCVVAATAEAQNARTWVSATGTDTSNTQCSVTAPCLTFAHAVAETQSGGEIDCLTPGGFGAVTIGISVTINCEGTSNGGITVNSGNAITINTAGTVVNLIGLAINGENNSNSSYGVDITAAARVTVRDCKIYGFTAGVGIYMTNGGGTLVADNVLVTNNSVGIEDYANSGVSNMSVRNSDISNNQDGIYVWIVGGTHAGVTVEQTTLAFNSNIGLALGADAGSVALIGGSTVVNNGTGVFVGFGTTVYSFVNNQIGGNGTDISGTLTPYPGGPLN
jgi:hypothetical protein